jgi:hypothetical protein
MDQGILRRDVRELWRRRRSRARRHQQRRNCYINYPDVDLNDHGGRMKALSLYYGDNLERLMRAKRSYDPHDYFQNAQSIPCA